MNFAKLSDEYSVATQIDPADVEYFAGEGYTAVICNRPDGEDAGQPSSDSIREACEQRGIDFHMIPMLGRMVSPESVHQLLAVMAGATGPMLAYCRSGTRSAILWQMASQTANPR